MYILNSPETKSGGLGVWNFMNKSPWLTSACDALWKTWDEFWERTNISGMCNARSSKSGFRTKLWMIIFAVFTVLTFTGISNVIEDFSRYPVVTFVTVEHNNQVHFCILIITIRGRLLDYHH